MTVTRRSILAAAPSALALAALPAYAQKKYDTGASDTEIKIGHTNPYSGPASAYGVIGKTIEAYFKKINAEGGINVRKLVESDEVLLVFNPLGTPSNTAIQKYLNTKKVPQLFVATGATKWNDPKGFPWTMGWQPNYQSETQIYAKYILKNKPDAKVAILYQNDDYGKDYLKGFRDGLGAKAASMIVMEESYEVSEPTIDSHIVNNGSGSLGSVIKPAGTENAQDIISSQYLKDPTDAQWKDDAGMKAWNDFLDKYYPEANRADLSVMYAYTVAQGLAHVLKACGDDL